MGSSDPVENDEGVSKLMLFLIRRNLLATLSEGGCDKIWGLDDQIVESLDPNHLCRRASSRTWFENNEPDTSRPIDKSFYLNGVHLSFEDFSIDVPEISSMKKPTFNDEEAFSKPKGEILLQIEAYLYLNFSRKKFTTPIKPETKKKK